MGNKLKEIDEIFNNQYKGLLSIQEQVFKQLENYSFDLAGNEITQAVVDRMDSFWWFHYNNSKHLLKRKVNYKADDYFTETCLLFLKGYFEQKGYLVESEAKLLSANIQPDITIKKGERIVAVIELKVSNGWKGKTMMEHLQAREVSIKEHVPNCYFGVIAFWDFFPRDQSGRGTKYIGIKTFNEKENHPMTQTRIEDLIIDIEKHIMCRL